MDKKQNMPIAPGGIFLLLIGVALMILGYILMIGGGSSDPSVFNSDAIFGFRRLTLAPLVIIAGIVVEIVGIMRIPRSHKTDGQK